MLCSEKCFHLDLNQMASQGKHCCLLPAGCKQIPWLKFIWVWGKLISVPVFFWKPYKQYWITIALFPLTRFWMPFSVLGTINYKGRFNCGLQCIPDPYCCFLTWRAQSLYGPTADCDSCCLYTYSNNKQATRWEYKPCQSCSHSSGTERIQTQRAGWSLSALHCTKAKGGRMIPLIPHISMTTGPGADETMPLTRNGCKSSGISVKCQNIQLCRNSSLFPEV